jgi:hypothetical protein
MKSSPNVINRHHTAPRAGYPGHDRCGTNQVQVSVPSRTVVVVNVKKIVGLLAIALLLFFVFTQPDNAAGSVTNIGTTLRDGAESVIRFVTQLV